MNEALRLADALAEKPDSDGHCIKAAAELRRLHALNQSLAESNVELMEALEWIDRRCDKNYFTDKHPLHQIHWEMAHDAGACAQAAISKASGVATKTGENT